MKINLKLLLILLVTLVIKIDVFAQNIVQLDDPYIAVNNTLMHKDSLCCTPYDIEDSLHQQFVLNTFSFLIEEGVYYDFRIDRIDKLQNAYGFLMHTQIDGRDVVAYVISPKSELIRQYEKIRKGKNYSINLRRYVKGPISRNIENPKIYDILLANSITPLMSIGSFAHIFISENLLGLNYIQPLYLEENNKIKSQLLKDVEEFVLSFAQGVLIDKDTSLLCSMTDSSQLKKTLVDASYFVGPSMVERRFKKPPKNLPKAIDKLKIDTNDFQNLFWQMLEKVNPFSIESNNFKIEDIKLDILYYYDDIFNVRLLWQNSRSRFPCAMHLSIKKLQNEYKLIGMTKLYI